VLGSLLPVFPRKTVSSSPPRILPPSMNKMLRVPACTTSVQASRALVAVCQKKPFESRRPPRTAFGVPPIVRQPPAGPNLSDFVSSLINTNGQFSGVERPALIWLKSTFPRACRMRSRSIRTPPARARHIRGSRRFGFSKNVHGRSGKQDVDDQIDDSLQKRTARKTHRQHF